MAQIAPFLAPAKPHDYRSLLMTRQEIRTVLIATNEQILGVLTRRQFTHPHTTLRQTLDATIQELGCCPNAISRAMQWLQLDWEQPVGRLRRTELTQLARTIHRLWRQSTLAPISQE
jgi:signal-transduction protein with cAMP-binding, CBS, and nucleotidyltransferase domain